MASRVPVGAPPRRGASYRRRPWCHLRWGSGWWLSATVDRRRWHDLAGGLGSVRQPGRASLRLFAGRRATSLRSRRRFSFAEFAGRLGGDGRRSRLGGTRRLGRRRRLGSGGRSCRRARRQTVAAVPDLRAGLRPALCASRTGRNAAGDRGSGGGGCGLAGAGSRAPALRTARIATVTRLGGSKRQGRTGTSHEQPRCHQGCSRGDAHTRSHVVTTPHDIISPPHSDAQ